MTGLFSCKDKWWRAGVTLLRDYSHPMWEKDVKARIVWQSRLVSGQVWRFGEDPEHVQPEWKRLRVSEPPHVSTVTLSWCWVWVSESASMLHSLIRTISDLKVISLKMVEDCEGILGVYAVHTYVSWTSANGHVLDVCCTMSNKEVRSWLMEKGPVGGMMNQQHGEKMPASSIRKSHVMTSLIHLL